ncbi:hypothetical protein FRC12_011393 [Ceratobasidium sp. 428]|nr:hypothetical protein FRC12_011393 [Ceratobasidium sp. 428]
MPRFQKLRHFTNGISVISQWTGKEAKALGRTFLTIVAGCNKPKLVTAVRGIVDFMARAHKHEVTDDDLVAMNRDLLDFYESQDVFIGGKKGMVKDERGFNKIRKIHMLTHYPYLIRQLGAPEGFNTKITERLHIDFVKKPWAATNHVNATQQMIAYLGDEEAWSLLRAYMHDAGLVWDSRVGDRVVDDDGGDDGEQEELVDGAGGREDEEVWQPSPRVLIAKRPTLGPSVKAAYLIDKHNAINLIPTTTDYLHSVAPGRAAFPISHDTSFSVWRRCRLRHRRLPFDPTLDPQTDQVRAFIESADPEGRVLRSGSFDIALFPSPDASDRQGLHRLEAGRVRAIFSLPRHLQSFSSEKLVYLERFCAFSPQPSVSTSLYTTQHASEDRRRSAIVILLSQLRMTCHLAPRFHLLSQALPVSSSTNLLSAHKYFFLNKYASSWLFSIFEYWEKQRRLTGEWYVLFCYSPPNFASPSYSCFLSRQFSFALYYTLLNMHASSPHPFVSRDMTPSADPEQFLQLRKNSTLPTISPSVSPALLRPYSSRNLPAPCFTYPPSSSVARTIGDTNEYLSRAPLDYTPVTLSPFDPHRRLSWTLDHDGAASSGLRYSPGRLNSSKPSASFILQDSTHNASLVHRRNRDAKSRGVIRHPTSLVRDDVISNHPGSVDLSASDEEGASRYETRVDSVGSSQLDLRRQRIVESEQRRRNDLRGGFARLKDALPVSRNKCSKLVLLDRAATYIGHLKAMLRDKRNEISGAQAKRCACLA